jgi:hypothetical protein
MAPDWQLGSPMLAEVRKKYVKEGERPASKYQELDENIKN